MAAPKGIEFTGLRELNAGLKRLGVDDAEIKTAMNEAGMIVVREAWRIGPTDSGKLLSTLKRTGGKNKLQVQVGNNTTAQYGWTMHANSIRYGYAKGYMTFDVPAHRRKVKKKGSVNVRAYSAVRSIRRFPFLFTAFERKQRDLLNSYAEAIDTLLGRFDNG